MTIRPRTIAQSTRWIVLGLSLSVFGLAWYGYQAFRAWQDGALQLANRRAQEATDLLVTASTRDMRAVQELFLDSTEWLELLQDSSYELALRHVVASAFARYPYPDRFFAWAGEPGAATVFFFLRSDRSPDLFATKELRTGFPVTILQDPVLARQLKRRVAEDGKRGNRYSIFDLDLADRTYQVVSSLVYEGRYQEQPRAVFGFMVDHEWVHEHYFPELTLQVQKLVGTDLTLALLKRENSSDSVLAKTDLVVERSFPILFFDPLLTALRSPTDLATLSLVAQASTVSDPLMLAAHTGARRAFVVASCTAFLLLLGFVITARAMQKSAVLTELRSEFVSTVTHELKTPIAGIRALGETLTTGRIRTADESREYAGLVVQQAKRLTRLVDNLLAYARITDVTEAYSPEELQLAEVVEGSLRQFSHDLERRHFQVDVEVPPDTPPIAGDRTALQLMLDNVVDNAITYSKDRCTLKISAHSNGRFLTLSVTDSGIGIANSEVQRVKERGFRGHSGISGGSGLGLSLAERIVADHGGVLDVDSRIGVGTTIKVNLPLFDSGHETTGSHR